MSNWVANPSEGEGWYVWDAEHPEQPPIYFGTMEECGGVVELLKLREALEKS